MKCPKCGYVSFDDLDSCKNCGLSFASVAEDREAETEETRLQDELFSLMPEEEERARAETEQEEARLRDELDTPAAELAPTPDEESRAPADGTGSELVPEAAEERAAAKEAQPTAEEGETAPEMVVLPKMELDFDPAAMAGEGEGQPFPEEAEEAGDGEALFPGEGAAARGGNEEPEPIIDDATVLPADLWVEEGAGFVRRLSAFGFDAGAVLAVLALFLVGAMAALGSHGYSGSQIRTPAGIGALFVPFYLLGLFISMCYFTFFVGWMGRTPGKALMGLVIHRTDGGPMTYTRAFLRWVGYLVSITFAGLGFLWIVIDERKRGWHDYLSGTWVKDLREEPEET